MIILLKLLAGFVMLVLGGDTLVNGSVAVAKKLKVPTLIVGIVLVGFGTSTPELVTCVQAALKGAPDLAVGNVVGSNIANILLVVGVSALCAPVMTPIRAFRRDGTVLSVATVIFVLFCLTVNIGRIDGAIMTFLLLVYVWFSWWSEKEHATRVARDMAEQKTYIVEKPVRGLPWGLSLTFGGIALTIIGANLLVDAATAIAEGFGVSEAVIGLTIVAIGTSLPELSTAIMAGIRGHSDVSLGNILGSNIYNMMGILGITALVRPLTIPASILTFDLWIMVAATMLMILVAVRHYKVTRREGGMLFTLYIGYLGFLYVTTVSGGY